MNRLIAECISSAGELQCRLNYDALPVCTAYRYLRINAKWRDRTIATSISASGKTNANNINHICMANTPFGVFSFNVHSFWRVYSPLWCDMVYYALICCAMLCYAMLCYAMLCYAMLCYAMP